ncbi:MAG TPA: hypothetical protein VHS97_21640, partial [Isosphaeraceae bacterium]|nr:hypothetical protein [Isosphaeraceae bacterium]
MMATRLSSSTAARNNRGKNRFCHVVTLVFLAVPVVTPGAWGQVSIPDQGKVVTELEKRGAQVFRDETQPDRPVISVDLDEREFDDAGLSSLKGLTRLQSLSLDGTRITD